MTQPGSIRFARGLAAALLLPLAAAAVAAEAKAYVGNFKDNTVSVIDTGRAAVIGVIPVATGPHGMVLSPDGRTLYVSGDGSSQVSVIDTATDRVARTLEVGRSPHGLNLSRDGRRLFVAVYGEDRVAVINTASGQQLASVLVAKPHTIAVLPGGDRAYVTSQAPGHFALAVVDLNTLAVLHELPLDKPPRDIESAFDGRAVYFTLAGENAVQVLDARSDQIVARVPTGISPHIANLFRGAAAATVVVQGPGELMLFDPSSHAAMRSIAVGRQPHWVAASADGMTMYVTNEGSNDVTIVDLASGATRAVPVGNAPRKIVVQQASTATSGSGSGGGARVSIANFAFAPQQIVIEAGQSVTWTNDDGAPHGLAYNDGGMGTDLLLPGASFSRRFDSTGSFDYVCSVHPYMTAKIVVRPR
jgi:YVTN family beta-propeller protein